MILSITKNPIFNFHMSQTMGGGRSLPAFNPFMGGLHRGTRWARGHIPTEKITTGHGEYVVFSKEAQGNRVVSEEVFQKVYTIFQEHAPIKLVNAGKSEEEVAERYKTLIRQGQSNRSES